MAGFVLGEEAVKQIQDLIRRENARLRNPDEGQRRQTPTNPVKLYQGFLNTALPAAANSINNPGTASLAIYYRDPSTGYLSAMGVNIVVTNRDLYFTWPAGAYLVVVWIEGEWRPLRPNNSASNALALNGSSEIAARSGTTPGSGTVTLMQLAGGVIASTSITVTAYNWSSLAITANAYLMIHQDPNGAWWIGAEDCD